MFNSGITNIKKGNIDDLFDFLRNRRKWISMDSDFNEFEQIFNNQSEFKPILWTGRKSTLTYLVRQLYKKGFIEDRNSVEWDKVVKCFVSKKGPYEKVNLKDQKLPLQDKELIDDFLSNLK